jgi:hypothetical protein
MTSIHRSTKYESSNKDEVKKDIKSSSEVEGRVALLECAITELENTFRLFIAHYNQSPARVIDNTPINPPSYF